MVFSLDQIASGAFLSRGQKLRFWRDLQQQQHQPQHQQHLGRHFNTPKEVCLSL
jgi:hypothetical protein